MQQIVEVCVVMNPLCEKSF